MRDDHADVSVVGVDIVPRNNAADHVDGNVVPMQRFFRPCRGCYVMCILPAYPRLRRGLKSGRHYRGCIASAPLG